MSVEDEVLGIRKKLEKMTEPGQDQSQALDILKALSRVEMNLTILTNTRIGMAVNALRFYKPTIVAL
jgi:transcription elongation factor S-II